MKNKFIKANVARFVYNHLKCRQAVDEDVEHARFHSLEEAMVQSKPFVNIFYYRTSMESKALCKLLDCFFLEKTI